MELEEAEAMLGDVSEWMLKAMERGLEMHIFVDEEMEKRRLEAVKTLLKAKLKSKREL